MSAWTSWIGREEIHQDRVDEAGVARWLSTFDRAWPGDGTVPQAYHWCLCLPDAPTERLGMDGHPARDDGPTSFLPPVPLPRRMWAASKVEFHAALRPGQSFRRISRVEAISEKLGASGRLVFAEIVHENFTGGELCIREIQSIVFREPLAAGSPQTPAPLGEESFDAAEWDTHRVIVPTEALLFRFSALTFNSHRIHYDLPYAAIDEGYRGVVVHGPLTATLLLDLAARRFGDNALRRFDFRAVSPAIGGEALHLVLRGSDDVIELGAFATDGRPVMSASASL